MVKLFFASNVANTFEFHVEPDMTVGETKAIVGEMIHDSGNTSRVSDDRALKMSFKGKPLVDDDTWEGVGVQDGDKVFAVLTITKASTARPTAQLPATNNKDIQKEEAKAAQQQMQMMGPMIDMMANNPMFFEMMKAQSPELQEAIKNNPELERELRNPETLKYLLRSQLDPDARREMNLSLQGMMGQINAIPGGAAMLERAAGGMLRDSQAYGRATAADLKEATEENAKPQEGQESNNQALPNPWARPGGAGGGANPFAAMMGGGAGATNNAAAASPFGFGGMPPPANGGGGANGGMDPMLQMLLGGNMGAGPANGAANGGAPAFNPMNFMNNPFMQAPPSTTTTANNGTPSSTAPPTAAPSAPTPSAPPKQVLTNQQVREQYGAQLAMLRDMGFEDEAIMIDALRHCDGDVDGAVCYIAELDE